MIRFEIRGLIKGNRGIVVTEARTYQEAVAEARRRGMSGIQTGRIVGHVTRIRAPRPSRGPDETDGPESRAA